MARLDTKKTRARRLRVALAVVLPFLVLAACSEGGDAVDDVATSDTSADVANDTLTPNPCVPPEGEPLAHRVVLHTRFSCVTLVSAPYVIADEGSWMSFRAETNAHCTDVMPEPVDFGSEYVVIFTAGSHSTCGFEFVHSVALATPDGPYVEVHMKDRSLGCQLSCSATGGYIVAVAVPRAAGDTPETCLWVKPGCTP